MACKPHYSVPGLRYNGRVASEKMYLGWEDITAMVRGVLEELKTFEFDAILAVSRGGLIPACLISEATGLRNILVAAVMFYTEVEQTLDEPVFLQFPEDAILYGKKILIVDDVWDSGKTAVAVRRRVARAGGKPTLACLHFKPANNQFSGQGPDVYARETSAWIVYPWDPKQGWTAESVSS
jgi:hypoxanthine phosphoribosyltransferase